MTLVEAFAQFIEHRTYLMNVSPNTTKLYKQVFRTTSPTLPSDLEAFTPALIKQLPIWLKQTPTPKGERSPEGINIYLEVWNAFFKWAFEELGTGYTDAHGHFREFHIPLVKCPKRLMPTYSDEHIRAILSYRPTCHNHIRVKALWMLAIDTGCRITELLTLTRDRVNLDQCIVRVIGKGNKERVVPFSLEVRKAMWALLRGSNHQTVFATRSGLAITARNATRDLGTMLDRLQLPRPKRLWHSTRRTFGTTYIRNGGDVFRLQQTLGHANLETTRRYVEIDIDDLRSVHSSLSPLSVVKR